MKKGWEVKKLGEVATVIAGQSPKGKYYNNEGSGTPFYQGKKEFGQKYIGVPTVWTTKITKIAEKDDILMSVRAPVGPINFATQKVCIGRGLAAIRVSKNINKDFLFSFLLKHEAEIIGNTGAVFNSINKAQIENLLIPLPPLPEQKRIVEILDKAFAEIDKAKANAEKNLKNAKELFDSYLNNIFENKGDGWEEQSLEKCFRLKSGDGLTSKMITLDGKYLVYGGNGIVGYYDAYNLDGSNIIIGRVGAQCGNVRYIDEKIWLTDNAFYITDFNFKFDLTFLAYMLNVTNLRKFARQAAQPVISNSSLKEVKLRFPKDIKKQQSIVQKLDELSIETKKLEETYKKEIENLEELKKSILKKAFKGEL